MLFRMKDEKAHQLEAELDKLQADGPAAWAKLPEEELFTPAGFSEERAEATSYSNYSYWGSVIQNFLKHKAAVVCLFLFLFLVIFSFIALAIGKYDYQTLVTDSSLAFRKPNSEYWFGTDNLGRDYWCQVWYATQVSCLLYTSDAADE